MAEQFARERDLPPPIDITLTATGCYVPDSCIPAAGALQLEIYISPLLALPLRLQTSGAASCKEPGLAYCHFDSLPAGGRELLEKLLFTYHRRAIASSKQHRN